MDIASGSAYGTNEGTATGDAAIVKSFAPAFDMGALFGQADREVFDEIGGMEVEEPGMDDVDDMPIDDGDGDEAWGGLDDYIGMGVLKEEVQEVVVQKKQERKVVEDKSVAPSCQLTFLWRSERVLTLPPSSFSLLQPTSSSSTSVPVDCAAQVQHDVAQADVYPGRDGQHVDREPAQPQEPKG